MRYALRREMRASPVFLFLCPLGFEASVAAFLEWHVGLDMHGMLVLIYMACTSRLSFSFSPPFFLAHVYIKRCTPMTSMRQNTGASPSITMARLKHAPTTSYPWKRA